jgi:hypothetical protein
MTATNVRRLALRDVLTVEERRAIQRERVIGSWRPGLSRAVWADGYGPVELWFDMVMAEDRYPSSEPRGSVRLTTASGGHIDLPDVGVDKGRMVWP